MTEKDSPVTMKSHDECVPTGIESPAPRGNLQDTRRSQAGLDLGEGKDTEGAQPGLEIAEGDNKRLLIA